MTRYQHEALSIEGNIDYCILVCEILFFIEFLCSYWWEINTKLW